MSRQHCDIPLTRTKLDSPELSSEVASSTINRLGLQKMSEKSGKRTDFAYDFFARKMAVEVSFGPGWGAAPLGSAIVRYGLKLAGIVGLS
jgi:hypothetical protein